MFKSVKVPNYVLGENVEVLSKSWDKNVIPQGTFVKPIELRYLPQHIKDEIPFWFKPETEVYVYCSYGFHPVPKKAIREV